MPQNIYELIWIFIIYAFLGWCTEVSYAALETGKFVNRGFLNGPYCPIYGFGVVIVVAILTPIHNNLIILFIGSMILTSVLEFMTGYILEKVFHNKWWDYSNKPFNIKGYICLKFSVLWGLTCVFIMKVFHPGIYHFIQVIPQIPGKVLITLLILVFFVDFSVTVATILNFNKRLRLMDEIAKKMHMLSDEIGENIYEGVTIVKEKSEDKKEDARKEYEELKKKYKELLKQKNFGHNRLLNAFPNMKSIYKEHIHNIRKKKDNEGEDL